MSSQGGVRFAVPIGIEHGGSVTSKQRDLVGKLAPLVQGNDGECAAARGVPIDRQILGVDLRKWPRQQKRGQWRRQETRQTEIRGRRTLTRLVSQALRLMCRLS